MCVFFLMIEQMRMCQYTIWEIDAFRIIVLKFFKLDDRVELSHQGSALNDMKRIGTSLLHVLDKYLINSLALVDGSIKNLLWMERQVDYLSKC